MDQAMTHWPLLSEERKTLDGLFQFHRFQSRFAIRLAVVLCLSFTFVYLTQWPFAYWYPMTVFLMLMPYAEESAARINNRVLGNLLGLLMTALLLSLFHSLPAYVFLVALMTCLMYYVPLTSTSMSTYGTCYGMILAILLVDIRLAIGLRLAYVAMAAVTAWTANRFLFPITEPGQVRDSLQTLLETDARMLAELQEMLSSNSSRHSFRQYLIRSNMLTQEMETLLAGSPSTAAHTLLLHLLPLQRKLSTELELLASYVHDHPGRFLPEQRGELRTLFSSLQKTLQALEQGSSPAPVPAPLPSLSKEQVYFHTLLVQLRGDPGKTPGPFCSAALLAPREPVLSPVPTEKAVPLDKRPGSSKKPGRLLRSFLRQYSTVEIPVGQRHPRGPFPAHGPGDLHLIPFLPSPTCLLRQKHRHCHLLSKLRDLSLLQQNVRPPRLIPRQRADPPCHREHRGFYIVGRI